jgi:hypothetical protein
MDAHVCAMTNDNTNTLTDVTAVAAEALAALDGGHQIAPFSVRLSAFGLEDAYRLREDPYPEKIKARLIIRSVESLLLIRRIRMHGYSEQEKSGIRALLRELQALVPRVGHLVSYRKNLPQAERTCRRLPNHC